MIVGRWYVQLAATWHWYLPLGIYMIFNLFIVSVHSFFFNLVSIRWNGPNVLALGALLTEVILNGLTLQKFVLDVYVYRDWFCGQSRIPPSPPPPTHQIYSVLGLPDLNIMPQQSIACLFFSTLGPKIILKFTVLYFSFFIDTETLVFLQNLSPFNHFVFLVKTSGQSISTWSLSTWSLQAPVMV